MNTDDLIELLDIQMENLECTEYLKKNGGKDKIEDKLRIEMLRMNLATMKIILNKEKR